MCLMWQALQEILLPIYSPVTFVYLCTFFHFNEIIHYYLTNRQWNRKIGIELITM